MIMSANRPPVQNFVQIRPLGASRQMGKYNRFFSFSYTFFNGRPTGETGRRIFTSDGSNDAVSSKGVFLGVKNSKLIYNPWKIPPKSKTGP